MQKVIDKAVYYFNYIKPVRKLKRSVPLHPCRTLAGVQTKFPAS